MRRKGREDNNSGEAWCVYLLFYCWMLYLVWSELTQCFSQTQLIKRCCAEPTVLFDAIKLWYHDSMFLIRKSTTNNTDREMKTTRKQPTHKQEEPNHRSISLCSRTWNEKTDIDRSWGKEQKSHMTQNRLEKGLSLTWRWNCNRHVSEILARKNARTFTYHQSSRLLCVPRCSQIEPSLLLTNTRSSLRRGELLFHISSADPIDPTNKLANLPMLIWFLPISII